MNASAIVGIVIVVALLVGAVGGHLWQDRKREERIETLIAENQTLKTNYDTCEETNETNLITINQQKGSIAKFIEEQNDRREENRLLAEELAARQLADNEASRRSREEVREILSAEACGAVEHPTHVHRVLNDAIAKASRRQD